MPGFYCFLMAALFSKKYVVTIPDRNLHTDPTTYLPAYLPMYGKKQNRIRSKWPWDFIPTDIV